MLPTLVVDDDPDQRALMRVLFERAGLGPVMEAVDGEDALRQAVSHQPALILLDLQMPGRGGIDVLPDLRAACPGAAVVIVSNLPRRQYEDAAISSGAVGYVEKRLPVDQVVDEVLAAASLSDVVVDRVTLDLEWSQHSPRAARELLRTRIDPRHTDLIAIVELLATELVTNSIVHAASAPRVEVELRGNRVRVAVHDDDPTMPHQRDPDRDRPGGRGMLLLDQLATRWGAEPTGDGKVVWFEVDRLPQIEVGKPGAG
jgi:DNA-binding NarL/FixJ family response regulator